MFQGWWFGFGFLKFPKRGRRFSWRGALRETPLETWKTIWGLVRLTCSTCRCRVGNLSDPSLNSYHFSSNAADLGKYWFDDEACNSSSSSVCDLHILVLQTPMDIQKCLKTLDMSYTLAQILLLCQSGFTDAQNCWLWVSLCSQQPTRRI